MKRKVFSLFFILIALIAITGCEEKKQQEESEEKIVTEEILEGTVDGYKFKVTDEVTERIRIQMNNGDIMLAVLSNEDAPITIKNFQKLVSEGVYDGLIFHRVIENFMIQGGDPTGTGYGDPSIPNIKGEFKNNGVNNKMSHERGVLSMARGGYDMNSASSQFFIVHQDSTSLDGDYASFGRVFAGLDVVDKIASVETDEDDRPLKEQVIKSIKFITIEK